MHTDDSIRRVVQELSSSASDMRPDQLAAKEQRLGWNHSTYSLIAHERIRLDFISTHMWDWAHLLLCDGLADVECGYFFKRLQRQASARSSMQEFADYVNEFTLPSVMGSVNYILSADRIRLNLQKAQFSCSASEFLTVAPLLQLYIRRKVLPRKDCEMECESMLAVLDYLELIYNIKAGIRVVAPDELLARIQGHLDLFKGVYTAELMRPKHHYILHLPMCLFRHKTLLSTLVNERRHKLVKRYTRDRVHSTRWELNSLEDVVAHQVYECQLSWYGIGLLDPHPAAGSVLNNLLQIWPDVTDFAVSIRGRACNGTIGTGDMVWYNTASLGTPGLYVGEVLLILTAMEIDLVLLNHAESVRDANDWASFTVCDHVLVVPLDAVLLAAHFLRRGNSVSVHKPHFLR